jgi:hypothetical protein
MLPDLPRQVTAIAFVVSGAATFSGGYIGWSRGGALGAAAAILLVWAIVAGGLLLGFATYCRWTAKATSRSEFDTMRVENDAVLR